MKNQKFGIEIELTGATRKTIAGIIAEYMNTEIVYEGGSYNTYSVKDSKGRTWKVMRDSSITAQRKVDGQPFLAREEYKAELVSPILEYEDIEQLQEIVRKIRRGGAFVNSSCGIHIHIDASKHTPNTLKNLVNIMNSKEDMIYNTLRIKKERLTYCKKVNSELVEMINKKKPKTINELADIWYSEYPNESRNKHYNSTRYHGLNLHSTFTKGTVEFRCFNSTTHAGEIKAYIQFCLAVNNQALKQRSAQYKKTTTNNPKYAFRCWLLRLGLIGDEFKTCRLHMIKNLEGDSAWRDPHKRRSA